MKKVIRNRRGLSGVVTTVLLILLIVAAVGLIWSFLRPTIEAGVGSVSAVCLTLDIRPVECTRPVAQGCSALSTQNTVCATKAACELPQGTVNCGGVWTEEAVDEKVRFKRFGGDAVVEEVFLIFDQASGDSDTISTTTQLPDLLETKVLGVDDLGDKLTSTTDSVSVRVKALNEQGEPIDCPVGASSVVLCE